MVGEMSVRGNVLVAKCPVGEVSVGELSVRGNVCQGSVRRGSISRGFVLGEVSVGEVSGRQTVLQSTNQSSFKNQQRKGQFFTCGPLRKGFTSQKINLQIKKTDLKCLGEALS